MLLKFKSPVLLFHPPCTIEIEVGVARIHETELVCCELRIYTCKASGRDGVHDMGRLVVEDYFEWVRSS